MNCYATLDELKTQTRTTGTTRDAEFLAVLDAASRAVDKACNRHFYTLTDTRYFTGTFLDYIVVDDLLSITSLYLKDSGAETYTDQLTENTDYVAFPRSGFPKTMLRIADGSSYDWCGGEDLAKITGVFGYGNGVSATPWQATGITVTLSSASATSGTLSASGTIQAGMTLLCGTEQIFVTGVSSTTVTVQRGINGTTAATQTAAASSKALYPELISRMTLWYSNTILQQISSGAFKSERIGDYQYTMADSTDISPTRIAILLAPYVKATVL